MLYEVFQIPIYLGGDQRFGYNVTFNNGPNTPINTKVGYLTGKDDYNQVRKVAQWQDLEYVNIRNIDYTSMYDVEYYGSNPWPQEVPVKFVNIILFSLTEQMDSNSTQMFRRETNFQFG